jgi:large subunit ribosomal protein L28
LIEGVGPMGRQCEVSGKKTSFGNHVTTRGKAKYLGGVGKKITGTTKRRFKPNLQRIKVAIDGETVRARVCVQCIRSGKIQRPIKRQPFATIKV